MSNVEEAEPKAAARVTLTATQDERRDFLRHSIAFNEHNIRSYDTKAQISLGAFLLSMTPLWTIVNSSCPSFATRPEAIAVLLVFIANILLYCFVLWPMRVKDKTLTAGLSSHDLFYVRDPLRFGSAQYIKKLEQLSIEDELTAESLKLAHIRTVKQRRFNRALSATFIFYSLYGAVFLYLRSVC
jgi:hypothetical protein